MKKLFLIAALFLTACSTAPETPQEDLSTQDPRSEYAKEEAALQDDLPLEQINLPEGFEISLWAGNVKGARSMTQSPDGTLYVGTRKQGKLYALKDRDGNGKADQMFTLAEGMNNPNGVAWKDGDLYVAEIHRVIKYADIDSQLDNPPEPELIAEYPNDAHHGWKFIRFSPEGELHVPQGIPCNICEPEEEIFGTLTKLEADNSIKILANGIRNTVGFDWHPLTGELWFTDNGADWLGNDLPADELNRMSGENQHFGYPYCHQGDLLDKKFGEGRSCDEFEAPVQNLGPHVASLGMRFYTGQQFPQEYSNQVFIAERGSWNRIPKIGYRVTLVRLDGNTATSYETFADGWLQGQSQWGRPVDVEILPDGSLLVSDDYAGAIYRISYTN